jgi:hypothetical protein
MIYAAVHKRSGTHGVLAGLYTLGGAVMAVAAGSPDGSVLDAVFSALLFPMWIAGGGHALAIRRWVFDLPRSGARSRLADRQRAALAAIAEEDAARREAMRIVSRDPNLAVSLKIGRIDITDRVFPDGGLIDVNNVPADVLGQATGLPQEICRPIIETRRALGGFQSVAEMSVTLDLPPHLLDKIADRLIFLPPVQQAT